MSDSLAVTMSLTQGEDPSLHRAMLVIDPYLFTDQAHLGSSGLTIKNRPSPHQISMVLISTLAALRTSIEWDKR